MTLLKHDLMEVSSSADVVRVRQQVRAWASEMGFGLVDQTKIVTAASELARNTLDYGGGGTVRLEAHNDGQRRGLRMIFEDSGPGIADIELALKDGYTTGNGLGLGLGGARRLVNDATRPGHTGGGDQVEIALHSSTRIPVDEPSQVGEARRVATEVARQAGFDATQQGKLAIV